MDFEMKENFLDMVKEVMDASLPLISNLSNLSSLLMRHYKGTSWCGFYLSDEDNNLYLGPFQGDLACYRIPYGKGVCGTSLKEKRSVRADNVHTFEGHIACSSLTNSEIVVPIIKEDKVKGVIDLDSDNFANYTEENQKELEEIAFMISSLF